MVKHINRNIIDCSNADKQYLCSPRGPVTQSDILEIHNFIESNYQNELVRKAQCCTTVIRDKCFLEHILMVINVCQIYIHCVITLLH